MKKTFCDVCGTEINKENNLYGLSIKIKTKNKTLVEHLLRPDKENPDDICKYCFFDAVAALDDRPKIEPLT